MGLFDDCKKEDDSSQQEKVRSSLLTVLKERFPLSFGKYGDEIEKASVKSCPQGIGVLLNDGVFFQLVNKSPSLGLFVGRWRGEHEDPDHVHVIILNMFSKGNPDTELSIALADIEKGSR